MWTQVYAPIGGSLGVSALAAAVPIVVLFLMLGVLRKAAWQSALTALASAFIVAIVVYKMPLKLAVISTVYGGAYGLFPIAWIVFAAIAVSLLPVMTRSTPLMPACALASVSPIATPLPPLFASSSGGPLRAKMSPACMTRSAGNTTNASPFV